MIDKLMEDDEFQRLAMMVRDSCRQHETNTGQRVTSLVMTRESCEVLRHHCVHPDVRWCDGLSRFMHHWGVILGVEILTPIPKDCKEF